MELKEKLEIEKAYLQEEIKSEYNRVLSVSVRRGIFFSEHQDCSRPRPLSTTDRRFRSEISMHMGQGGGLP